MFSKKEDIMNYIELLCWKERWRLSKLHTVFIDKSYSNERHNVMLDILVDIIEASLSKIPKTISV